ERADRGANVVITRGGEDCSRPPPSCAGSRQAKPIRAPIVHRRQAMNLIIWLIIGGIIGWLASLVMKTDGQQGIILNVVVGIVGSWIGGWLLAPLIGGAGAMAYVSAFLGAIILLAIVNLFRRGRVR